MVALSVLLDDHFFVGPPHVSDEAACSQVFAVLSTAELIHAVDADRFGAVGGGEVKVFPHSGSPAGTRALRGSVEALETSVRRVFGTAFGGM